MTQALLVIHVLVCVGIIGLVLIQHGKGADAGAAFGSGASGTVFGSGGSASFLTRLTAVLATGFFITSMALAMFAGTYRSGDSVVTGTGQRVSAETQDGDDSEGAAPAPPESRSGEQAPAGGQKDSAQPAPAPPTEPSGNESGRGEAGGEAAPPPADGS